MGMGWNYFTFQLLGMDIGREIAISICHFHSIGEFPLLAALESALGFCEWSRVPTPIPVVIAELEDGNGPRLDGVV